MNTGSILFWGFVATVLLTSVMTGAQGLGLTRISLPHLLGTMVTGSHDRALAAGTAIHLVNGWLFALLYAWGFEQVGRATWWLGGAAGLLHGVFVLTAGMSVLPGIHPRMASERQGPTAKRQLQPPGFLALHYGQRTPAFLLAAHVLYGIVLGAFYVPAR